jgi:predicted Zn-dependent peptidase
VRAMVDRTFGRHARTGYKPAPTPTLEPLSGVVRRTMERPEQQARLVLGWRAPGLADRDSLALDLLATILAGSESSRLAATLRDSERIVSPAGGTQQRPLPAPPAMSAGREVFIVPGAPARHAC